MLSIPKCHDNLFLLQPVAVSLSKSVSFRAMFCLLSYLLFLRWCHLHCLCYPLISYQLIPGGATGVSISHCLLLQLFHYTASLFNWASDSRPFCPHQFTNSLPNSFATPCYLLPSSISTFSLPRLCLVPSCSGHFIWNAPFLHLLLFALSNDSLLYLWTPFRVSWQSCTHRVGGSEWGTRGHLSVDQQSHRNAGSKCWSLMKLCFCQWKKKP